MLSSCFSWSFFESLSCHGDLKFNRVYIQRKHQQQANFLARRARSAHRFHEFLETSLSETTAQTAVALSHQLWHATTKQDLEKELTEHKSTATKSREYYKSTTDKCKQQWKKIVQLTNQSVLSRSEKEELASTKHCFTATISADFQQSKLIPSWGKTEQPGSTYYLQKVSPICLD